jgi:hypothetical protein
MRLTSPLCAFVASLVGLAIQTAPPDPPGGRQAPPVKLTVGLSDQAVLQHLGPPGRKSRQVLLHRMLEQWHYAEPHHLRLTLECERGQQPSLKRIERLPRPER